MQTTKVVSGHSGRWTRNQSGRLRVIRQDLIKDRCLLWHRRDNRIMTMCHSYLLLSGTCPHRRKCIRTTTTCSLSVLPKHRRLTRSQKGLSGTIFTILVLKRASMSLSRITGISSQSQLTITGPRCLTTVCHRFLTFLSSKSHCRLPKIAQK